MNGARGLAARCASFIPGGWPICVAPGARAGTGPVLTAALEKDGMPVIHKGRYDSDDGTYICHDSLASLGVLIELLHSDPKK